MPGPALEGARASAMWGWFTALAHTLPYDVAVCGPGHMLPTDRLATITVPTLVMGGGKSEEWMLAAARAVAENVPGARHLVLENEDHGVLHNPDALRPVLLDLLL
ncbi:alpha/beta fold hydrolase [Actinopolymorpha pittospori]